MPSSGPLWALLGLFFQKLSLFKQIQNVVLNDAVNFPVLVPSKTFIILVICLTSGRFYGCDERMLGLCNKWSVDVGGTCIKA